MGFRISHQNQDTPSLKPMKNGSEQIFKQAAVAHEEGRLADAEKAYLELLEANPDSGSVLNALGTVYWDQSQYDSRRNDVKS